VLDVTTTITIARPRELVAAYAENPDNAPTWYHNIKSVRWLTAPPMAVGSRVAFVAKFLGRTLIYTYRITDWVPGETLVMATSEGPFPMETTYHWVSRSEHSTEMMLRNRGRPTGFSVILSPFIALAVRRENGKDLRRLKQVLEERP
jgi:uncharacterized membrane protein